jgi:hypothetical protein
MMREKRRSGTLSSLTTLSRFTSGSDFLYLVAKHISGRLTPGVTCASKNWDNKLDLTIGKRFTAEMK